MVGMANNMVSSVLLSVATLNATVIDILYVYICTYRHMPIPVSKCHASSSGLATSLRMIATINFILTSVIALIVGIVVPYSLELYV